MFTPMEKLDFEKLMNEHNNQEWVSNKSFERNITDKINEMIDHINEIEKFLIIK